MDHEIIDISPIHLNENFDNYNQSGSGSRKKSSNFGDGIELLMNGKKKENNRSDIDIAALSL